MKELSQREMLLANVLVENFYKIVPLKFRTYCSLTSRISRSVLLHFGIEADLLPCQVWLVTPDHNFVVGFTGKSVDPSKWNGHVVCTVGNYLIDTALHHFTREFDLTVPQTVVTPRFSVPTQVLARANLNEQNHLWWHQPPVAPEIDLTIPDDPPEVVASYARQLIELISTLESIVAAGLTWNTGPAISNMSMDNR